MSVPELIVVQTSKPSALEFLLKTGDLRKKPSFIEIVAAATENKGVGPVILTRRNNVDFVQSCKCKFKFKLKNTTVVLDEAFGLQLAVKYCIKIVLYDENRSKLAESLKIITTLAEVPTAPVITTARSKEVGQVELTLKLGKWLGYEVKSARVFLFKDVANAGLDDISIIEIPLTVPTQHATGATVVLDLAPQVVLGADTDYICKVALDSNIGLGPFSEAFSFKAVDVPDGPLNVEIQHLHLENTLAVTWKAGADSVQYGNLLRFRVDLFVMPFVGSSKEILFESIAEKVPLLNRGLNQALGQGFNPDFYEENSKVPQISLEKLNEHKFVFDQARQTEFLSQMSVLFPEYNVSRQLKFKAKLFASNGVNSSLAVESRQITVIRFALPDNYTDLFDLTAKGLQTKKESGIERKINFEAKPKVGITFAQLKSLLVDLPTTRRLDTPKPPPAPWAKGIAFQLDLIQNGFKNSFVNSIIIDDATPEVSITPITTNIPFLTSDELLLTFWLIDANDNKSYSIVYPLSIPLEVPALVYRPDTPFTVNAGIVSALVIAVSGTKTETLSAKFLLRNFSDVTPNRAPFIETLPLLLDPTEKNENEFKISYDFQLPANASQVSEIKLSVFEKQSGVITPLKVFSEPNGSRVVISNTNLTDVADSFQFNLFDRTISPSSPSEYVALLYVEKSVILQKLKVYNNVEITEDITIKSSTAGTVLTIADESLLENKIDITLFGRDLTSLRIPLASDLELASDLALLNKTSLKDTHLFVYLNIQGLLPTSSSSSSFIITAKVNRFVNGQSYDAERILSTAFRDDIGFIDASEGKTYDCDGNQFAFRVNRNYNFSDTLFITSWPIAYDGKTTDTPEPVFNYVASNQFIFRNYRRELWALINLKAGGGPVPYDVAAVMVILNTANRSTSNTFRIFLKNESIDGSIVRELNTIRVILPGMGGGLQPSTKPDISIGYTMSLEESLTIATKNANLAKRTRNQKEVEANVATAVKTEAVASLEKIQTEKANVESRLLLVTEKKIISDKNYKDLEQKVFDADQVVISAKIQASQANDEFLLVQQELIIIKEDEELARIAYQKLLDTGTATVDELTMALKLLNLKSRQAADIGFKLLNLEEVKLSIDKKILNFQQDSALARENLVLAQADLITITSEYDATEQELLKVEDDIIIAQQYLSNAEAVERGALLDRDAAVTLKAAAVKDLQNIQKALAQPPLERD